MNDKKLKRILTSGSLRTCPDRDDQVLAQTLHHFRAHRPQSGGLALGRMIIKTRTATMTSLAAILLLAMTIVIWNASDNSVWALEQTMAALQQVETLYVHGKTPYGEMLDFDCWIQFSSEDDGLLKLRFESNREIVVVNGAQVQAYDPIHKTLNCFDGRHVGDLKLWYKAAELGPWVSGKIFKTLKLFADDWTEIVDVDPQTGKTFIHVTCNYPPTQHSFYLRVDAETQLFTEAKMWRNLHHEGQPAMDVTEFIYNVEVPDDFFVFEIPDDTEIIDHQVKQEGQALLDQAEHLFHQEKKINEAMEVYRQVYEQFPDLKIAETALMMIGICHDHLDQHDLAIAAYEKAIREYPDQKGWSETTYYYLAGEYRRAGRLDEALAAYHKCVELCEGVRDPDAFPWKNARQRIQAINDPDFITGQAWFDLGEQCFHKDKQYLKAIQQYQRAYDQSKVIDPRLAHNALMMIGLSYGRLDQQDLAIDYYEQAVTEYPDLKGWVEASYYYLGSAYQKAGRTEEALEAYQKCLKAGQGIRDPEGFPMKSARERIAEIQQR